MLDDDDLNFAILFTPTSVIGALLWLIVIVIPVAFFVCSNHDECAKMKCEHGQPRLMNHECLCVDVATPQRGETR